MTDTRNMQHKYRLVSVIEEYQIQNEGSGRRYGFYQNRESPFKAHLAKGFTNLVTNNGY